ncbi:putative ATP-dependent RNA helicase TDRD12 isoform X2 [Lycorma delicatula]|uniref:putative ATP-dependent RNA helicase TDRD12 isoform X2 n=1 Tax=Lycorma delicatula TaxID=130591 RepID=UPI003F515FA4
MDNIEVTLKEFDEVAVKNVDNDGFIWVVKLPAANLVFKKHELESANADALKRWKNKKKEENTVFKVGERCAVSLNGDCWFRAEVLSVNNEKSQVFLIDQGNFTFISNCLFLPLPEKLKHIPSLAYRISFFGIQPVCMEFTNEPYISLIPVECNEWKPSHLVYFKNCFDEADKIYFKEVNKVRGIGFGIIIIKRGEQYLCLNDELCCEKLATKNPKFEFDHNNANELLNCVGQRNNTGNLPNTSREYLLRAAFGESVCKSRINDSLKSCEKSADHVNISLPSESNCSSNNNFSGHSDLSKRYLSESDTSSSNESNLFSKNIKREKESCEITAKGKQMSSNVLMLYEKFTKRKEKSVPTQSEASNTESDTEQHHGKSFYKKIYNGVLLHQSPSIKDEIEPSERLIDCNINEKLHKVLESRQRKDLTQLQMFAYPVLTKHHNLVVVGNPHSGKTLASIVAVLTLLNDSKYYQDLRTGFGPKAVFLTSFSQNVRSIEKLCQTLLSKQKNIIVKSASGGDAVEKMKFELAGGCDILVTTPRCLIRLLNARFVTNINRLCHLIFDDADFIFDHFLPEIQLLNSFVTKLECVMKPDGKHNVQKIVLAEKWSPVLENFVKEVIKDGFICIPTNNLLEAAVYSRVKPNIQFLKPENKCSALTELLTCEQGITMRSIIVCRKKEEAEELEKKLDPICGRLLVAHEGMDHVAVGNVRRAWLRDVIGLHAVIICTDDVLSELNITNGDRLIHYSLPSSKTFFSSRFMCLLEKYHNIFMNQGGTPLCKVYVFVDEENDEQFPEIVDLMNRLKFPLPEKIKNVVKRINLQKETAKKKMPLCENVKQFGSCWKIAKCHFRHIVLSEVDEIKDFPVSGYVKLKVVFMHDASHLSVILLEHKYSKEWKNLPGVNQLAVITLKMEKYFENEEERALHPKPKIGDIVAIEMKKNDFQRAVIIDVLKFDDKKDPTDVKVKLLEVGEVVDVKTYDVYYLSEDLRKIPPQAVDIYLCRLQPTDLDKYWSDAANKLVCNWLLETQSAIDNYGENHYLVGHIVLSIGRNLWLDPLTHSEWLDSTKTEVYQHSFRHDLIKKNLAVEKSDHLELIYGLCKSAGLKSPVLMKDPVKKEESSLKGQWAHLNRDEFVDVNVVFVRNPEQIFLKIPKFADRLDELQKDINKLEKRQFLKKGDLNIGDLCLALYLEDNSWNRAKIINFPETDKVEVFYADHGDFGMLSWNQLAKIPADLVTRLPLQAIECRLAGIQKLQDSGWSENSVSVLYTLVEVEVGLWKTLSAYVLNLELKAEITGGRKYAVALLDTELTPVVLLNKELVVQAEANWQIEEKGWLDSVCNKYMEYIQGASDQNFEACKDDEEEDWDKCDQDSTAVKSSGTEIVPQMQCNPACSIVDEHLQQLYKALEDDDDCIENPLAIIKELLHITESSELKINGSTTEKLCNSASTSTAETNPNILTSLESVSKENPAILSLPKSKSAILSLPKSKPALFSLPRKKLPSPKEKSNILLNYMSRSQILQDNKNTSNQIVKCLSSGDDSKSSKKSKISNTENDLSDKDVCQLDVPQLKQLGSVHTPLVYWYQDLEFIYVHIKLIGVEIYNIKWTYRTLCFSTWHENKFYRLDFNLFGPIDPETLQHYAKGFWVEVKMKKVLRGSNWLRLLQTKANYNWLKFNPEHIVVSNDSDDDGVEFRKDKKKKILKKIDKSQFLFGPRPPCADDSDSASSDTVEPNDMEDDPDDPFNLNI